MTGTAPVVLVTEEPTPSEGGVLVVNAPTSIAGRIGAREARSVDLDPR